MATNPLSKAIGVANKQHGAMEKEFFRLGSRNPKGIIPAAYSTAGKALNDIFRGGGKATAGQIQEASTVFTSLRTTIRLGTLEALDRAETLSTNALNAQMRAYKEAIPDREVRPDNIVSLKRTAADSTLAQIDQQILASQALLVGGDDVVEITGGLGRSGIIRPGPVLSTSVFWFAQTASVVFKVLLELRMSRGADTYQKQAIAAIQLNTTQCCLRVHGQIQDLNDLYHLTGTPRFSDYRDHPPFHWACRTSQVLYREEHDDGITERLRRAAATAVREIAENEAQDKATEAVTSGRKREEQA